MFSSEHANPGSQPLWLWDIWSIASPAILAFLAARKPPWSNQTCIRDPANWCQLGQNMVKESNSFNVFQQWLSTGWYPGLRPAIASAHNFGVTGSSCLTDCRTDAAACWNSALSDRFTDPLIQNPFVEVGVHGVSTLLSHVILGILKRKRLDSGYSIIIRLQWIIDQQKFLGANLAQPQWWSFLEVGNISQLQKSQTARRWQAVPKGCPNGGQINPNLRWKLLRFAPSITWKSATMCKNR
jgi:hypothetical protein